MEQLDQIHVVSDLHFGGSPGHQIFDQGKLLAALIDHLRERAPADRVGLVLDGDIVDFLAADDAAYLDPLGAAAKLQVILADPAFRPVFEALARFVHTDRRVLVLVLGNHDVELALPEVQERLLRTLTGGDPAALGRVRIAMDGTGWACSVGGRRVLCVHGNDADPFNVIDYGALLEVTRAMKQDATPPAWTPNAGTRLVVDVMNTVKENYPLVDLLKPETVPVFSVLFALDPSQTKALKKLAPILVKAAGTDVRLRTGWLGGPGEALDEDKAMDLLLQAGAGAKATQAPAKTDSDAYFARANENRKAGKLPSEVTDPDAKLGFGGLLVDTLLGRSPVSNLRDALAGWLKGDKTYMIDAEDEVFEKLDAGVSPEVDFIVAGHTHLARARKRRRGEGLYFNSGTWIRLIRLTEAMLASDEAFKPVYEAFKAKSLAALDASSGLVLRRPTVVSVEADGAEVVGWLREATLASGAFALAEVEKGRLSMSRAQ